jgi:hypothetical protein
MAKRKNSVKVTVAGKSFTCRLKKARLTCKQAKGSKGKGKGKGKKPCAAGHGRTKAGKCRKHAKRK